MPTRRSPMVRVRHGNDCGSLDAGCCGGDCRAPRCRQCSPISLLSELSKFRLIHAEFDVGATPDHRSPTLAPPVRERRPHARATSTPRGFRSNARLEPPCSSSPCQSRHDRLSDGIGAVSAEGACRSGRRPPVRPGRVPGPASPSRRRPRLGRPGSRQAMSGSGAAA